MSYNVHSDININMPESSKLCILGIGPVLWDILFGDIGYRIDQSNGQE